MNRVVVVANIETLRAFRLGSTPVEDRINFNASEIDLPPDAIMKQPRQCLDFRLEEIAGNVDQLIAAEKADSWFFIAPFGLMVTVLPLLSGTTISRLAGANSEDLANLQSTRAGSTFPPARRAA